MDRGRAQLHRHHVVLSARRDRDTRQDTQQKVQDSVRRGAIALLPMLVGALLALASALVLTVRIEEHRLAAERRRAIAAILAESNRSAERDTTRNAALENRRLAKLLGDSLRVVEKEAVQVAQRRDALDAALGRERAARYAATAAVDSLHAIAASLDSAAAKSNETRMARFEVRQAPYSVVAEVEFPVPPDSARLRLAVSIDPIPILARVQCSPVNGGAAEAVVSVQAPSWANVRIGTAEQSPGVCGAQRRRDGLTGANWRWLRPHLVAGIGRGWGRGMRGGWAMFVGAALVM